MVTKDPVKSIELRAVGDKLLSPKTALREGNAKSGDYVMLSNILVDRGDGKFYRLIGSEFYLKN